MKKISLVLVICILLGCASLISCNFSEIFEKTSSIESTEPSETMQPSEQPTQPSEQPQPTEPTSSSSSTTEPQPEPEELVFEHGDNFTEEDIEFVKSLHGADKYSSDPIYYTFNIIINKLQNNIGFFYQLTIDIDSCYIICAYIDLDVKENLKIYNSNIVDVTKYTWFKFYPQMDIPDTIDDLEMCFGYEVYSGIIEKDVVNNIDYCQPFIYYFDYNNANNGKPNEGMLMYMKLSIDITDYIYIRRNPYDVSCYQIVSNQEGETFFKLYSDVLYENGRIVEHSKNNNELLGIYFDVLSAHFVRVEELDYEIIDPCGEKATSLFLGISLNTLKEVLFNDLTKE